MKTEPAKPERPHLYETAQARRYYHHKVHGGTLTPEDIGRMVEYIERRDTEIARLKKVIEALVKT